MPPYSLDISFPSSGIRVQTSLKSYLNLVRPSQISAVSLRFPKNRPFMSLTTRSASSGSLIVIWATPSGWRSNSTTRRQVPHLLHSSRRSFWYSSNRWTSRSNSSGSNRFLMMTIRSCLDRSPRIFSGRQSNNLQVRAYGYIMVRHCST